MNVIGFYHKKKSDFFALNFLHCFFLALYLFRYTYFARQIIFLHTLRFSNDRRVRKIADYLILMKRVTLPFAEMFKILL